MPVTPARLAFNVASMFSMFIYAASAEIGSMPSELKADPANMLIIVAWGNRKKLAWARATFECVENGVIRINRLENVSKKDGRGAEIAKIIEENINATVKYFDDSHKAFKNLKRQINER